MKSDYGPSGELEPLLGADEPAPGCLERPLGLSPFVMLGDHAGRAIPGSLVGLGLSPDELDRHIAWDIGVAGLGRRLSAQLDATFIHQRYSRLVIDCNRAPDAPSAIPEVSDETTIPGNLGLSDEDKAARRRDVFEPYHALIAQMLNRRSAQGRPTLLFSLHSFTPVMAGFQRPWRYGVLHRGDSSLSHRVLAALVLSLGEAAGDNEPYAMDGIDYTIPHHADARGLDYLELEVRQDLIDTPKGQADVADFLAPLLAQAMG